MKVTASLIKADVGGFPGHASVHDLKETWINHVSLLCSNRTEESGIL